MTCNLYWLHRSSDVKEKLSKELANLGYSLNPMATFCIAYLTSPPVKFVQFHWWRC
ncbi:hypothetical protein [cyanobacterium endosymbiont of Rhopalodia gibberula]|uniref:hypothetical protein n=1 Tax=cyanobacterium endosymbiont of Rhopalodia gibberula TaxID=1763363 RepID=UPI00155844C2|nr:hypothetical protein [cyanobacterium endosymbiont of Rhopalodia gibberula]